MTSLSDKFDAFEHLSDFLPEEANEQITDFRFSQPEIVSLEVLEGYDDFGSWPEWGQGELLELDDEEVDAELEYFRGDEWAKRAWKWLESGTFPPVIVADLPEVTTIADGRGRISVAIGMDWTEVPVIWMTRKA